MRNFFTTYFNTNNAISARRNTIRIARAISNKGFLLRSTNLKKASLIIIIFLRINLFGLVALRNFWPSLHAPLPDEKLNIITRPLLEIFGIK